MGSRWILLALLVFAAPAEAAAVPLAWGKNGAIACSAGPAVEAGRELLAAGGNAIDAAVGTGFAAGVAHPFSSGLGGGGFLVLRVGGSGEVFAIDAREMAPGAARRDMFVRPNGEVDAETSRSGGLAVAVPGLVQGLYEAHARFGRLPWSRVLAPAIRMAREGVPVGPYHRAVLARARPLIERFAETARIQLDDGELPETGWRLRQPDLARTLEAIARSGPRAMTEGPIAEAIVRATREAGGVITLVDLAGYRTRWVEPLRGTYRGLTVFSMPPPSSGGVHLIQMLNTLEGFELARLGANSSEAIHLISEAMKLAFADRAVHLGDPAFFDVPTAWLTSKAYGQELAARLRPRPFWRRLPWHWGRPHVLEVRRPGTPPRDGGTTHISVLDAAGNAVALTQTINTLFGSGVTAAGTGIVLNNEMDDFSAAPDVPNAFGLVGDAANAIAPGKRPLSSMTPTIVLREGVPWLVAGSPMGPFIITTVLQTLLNLVDFSMDLAHAIAAPRFHQQWLPDRLYLEPEHPRDVVERLSSWGHPVFVAPFHFGASAVVLDDPEAGAILAAADPRRDAGAAGD
ncbi:MAG: gamma-glutamyltransferase [Myxococcota bacterium]